jgi:hypothetical protein
MIQQTKSPDPLTQEFSAKYAVGMPCSQFDTHPPANTVYGEDDFDPLVITGDKPASALLIGAVVVAAIYFLAR